MKSKIHVLFALVLAIMLGCVATTSVEAPTEVYATTTFQATVHTVIADTNAFGNSYPGILSVLVSEQWYVDSILLDGYGYSGPMLPYSYPWTQYEYPPSTGYEWLEFEAPQTLLGDLGDTGQATVFITTGETPGSYTTAFLGAILVVSPSVTYRHVGDPCSCTVEVTLLNLEHATWGSIKSGIS